MNALIVLKKRRSELFSQRSVLVHVLDVDDEGPKFGAEALASLRAPGAPLCDLNVIFEHSHYDWRHPEDLPSLVRGVPGAIVATSSEGALFEYGSDDEIVSNLRALGRLNPRGAQVVGSVTRSDGAAPYLTSFLQLPTRPRTLQAFEQLARQAGYQVRHSLDRPFSHHVCLRPDA